MSPTLNSFVRHDPAGPPPRTFLGLRFFRRCSPFSLLCVVVSALALASAAARPSNCEALLRALGEAESAHNKALGVWKQATTKVSQAEYAVSVLVDKLKANDKAQIAAIRILEAAKADQALCESAKGTNLAPLNDVDCAKVPGRISQAEKNLAGLEEAHKTLEDDLQKKEQEVEDREQEAAAAHAAEIQAWAALEAAKKAAAGCYIAE